MFRFFGQPKFDLDPDNQLPIGYELFIREWRDGRWLLPEDFGVLTDTVIEGRLDEVLAVLPKNVAMVSFNLEQDQFIAPQYLAMCQRVQARTEVRIFIELTERLAPNVTEKQIVQAAKAYADAGLLVCVDDVGTGQNTPKMVEKMNPWVAEYKFALQNFRPFNSLDAVKPQLDFWYHMAQVQHKFLAIEGIETPAELARIRAEYPCDVVQGYLLGKPALLQD